MGWLDTYTTKPPYLSHLYKTPLTQSHLQSASEIIAKWPVAPSRGISVAVLQSSVNGGWGVCYSISSCTVG